MNTTEKIYIGKGTQVQNFDMYNVTLNLSKAEANIFEHNGEKFLRITVARTKQPDSLNRTHTAYVTPYQKANGTPATGGTPEKSAKAKAEKKEKIEPSFSNH